MLVVTVKAAPSTKDQRKMIHVLTAALGIDEDDRRSDMELAFGVRSSVDLNYVQAGEYVERLEKTAIQAGVWKHHQRRKDAMKKYDDLGGRPGFATPAQMRLIEWLWSEVSRYQSQEDRDRALSNFLFRHYKRSHITMLEQRLAPKVVEALKTMKKQTKKETA